MSYAVNLADMTKEKFRLIAPFLVGPVQGEVVDTEGPDRVDGKAVMLACDDERAAAIVAVIRMRMARNELRCYQGHGRTWKRV